MLVGMGPAWHCGHIGYCGLHRSVGVMGMHSSAGHVIGSPGAHPDWLGLDPGSHVPRTVH